MCISISIFVDRTREASDKRIILMILITRSRRFPIESNFAYVFFRSERNSISRRMISRIENRYPTRIEKLGSINRLGVRISESAVATVACFQAWCEPSSAGREGKRGRQKLDDGRRLEIKGKRSKSMIDRRSFSRGFSRVRKGADESGLSIVLAFHPRCWPPRE